MKRKLNCVLLVDDDDATNFLNRKVIEAAGIAGHIETVLNGREALDYLTNQGKYTVNGSTFPQPVLILLDINMPVMDGWEFMESYHRLDDNQKGEIVIVMLTTSLNPDDKKKAAAISEISDFKNKPLEAETLDEIMREYFSDYL